MSAKLIISLPGEIPVQQGSKTMIPVGRPCPVCRQRRQILVEAADVANKTSRNRLKDYRERVAAAAMRAATVMEWRKMEGGVDLDIVITYERPTTHIKKNGSLRKGKPIHKVSKPDLDKLLRAINDALAMAGIFKDDSQVVDVRIRKRYASPSQLHGVTIEVSESQLGLAGMLLDLG